MMLLVVASTCLLAAAPASPDLTQPWAAVALGGRGPFTRPSPPKSWFRYDFTPTATFAGWRMQARGYPGSRPAVSETLTGGQVGPSDHFVFTGTVLTFGPADNPVRRAVSYDLRYDAGAGRFVGTRREAGKPPAPIGLAPLIEPGSPL